MLAGTPTLEFPSLQTEAEDLDWSEAIFHFGKPNKNLINGKIASSLRFPRNDDILKSSILTLT